MVRSWGWRCGRVSFGQFFTSFLDNILVSKQTVASNIKYIILFYYSRTIASTRMEMGVKLFIGSMTWCLGEPLYCINTINSNRSMATNFFLVCFQKKIFKLIHQQLQIEVLTWIVNFKKLKMPLQLISECLNMLATIWSHSIALGHCNHELVWLKSSIFV
jgi:hypothetical protein